MYWFSGTTTLAEMLNLINIEKGCNKILTKYDNLFPYENLALKFKIFACCMTINNFWSGPINWLVFFLA